MTIDDDTHPLTNRDLVAAMRHLLGPEEPSVERWVGDSDLGLAREENEDRFGNVSDTVFVIADGMGGHSGGALAAETVIEAVRGVPTMMFDLGPDQFALTVNEAVRAANAHVGAGRSGSTMTALGVRAGRATVVNVGDSRAYRLRGDRLEQLTRDHTLRNLTKSLTPAQDDETVELAADGPAGALTSFLGIEPANLSVDSFSVGLEPGDRFLLCTDGVHHQVDQEQIRATLASCDCAGAVTELLERAASAGGWDNATAMVIDVGGRS
ncbi:MAG: protein phosphatase 2C domain-containing protein [Actinomycetota bacterium]